jgi:hypothetical protein
MDLFATLKEVTKNQTPWDNAEEDFKSAYSQFMINRFASSVSIYILPLSKIDRFKVSNKVHHQYITSFFHKNDHYFNYKAYKKPKNDLENSISFICRYFEIGPKEAEIYIDLMTDEQIKDICSLYKTK